MTAYTAIPDADIDPESPGTTTLFTRLRNNPIAITEGSSGAPKIQLNAMANDSVGAAQIKTGAVGQWEITANAVGQSELKTTTASQSLFTSNYGTISLTGGSHTMGWFLGSDPIANTNIPLVTTNTPYSSQVTVYAPATYWMYVYSRYIQASPPWNLGNGDIPLFVMAVVHKSTKQIVATSVAEDPPWYAYGSHNTTSNGKLRLAHGLWGKNIRDVLDGKVAKDTRLPKKEMSAVISTPFSQSEKNIDMNEVPHLFDMTQWDTEDYKVVLLDPVSDFVEELREINCYADQKGENISSLLQDKYIIIGDELSGVNTPRGVIAVGAKWKNSTNMRSN